MKLEQPFANIRLAVSEMHHDYSHFNYFINDTVVTQKMSTGTSTGKDE